MCLIGLFGDYGWKQSLDSWLLRKVGGSTWIQHHTLLSTNLQDTCFRWTELFPNSVSIRQAESWRENGVWKPSFQALLSNSVCLCFYSVLSPDHLVSLKRWPLKKKKKKQRYIKDTEKPCFLLIPDYQTLGIYLTPRSISVAELSKISINSILSIFVGTYYILLL